MLVYFVMIIGFGKLFRFDLKSLFMVSNANVGGFMMVCGMVMVKGWSLMVIFGIFVGIFGMVMVIFLGIGFGMMVLKYM